MHGRDEFIQNTRGNGDGEDALPVTEQELGAIYDSIRAKPLISLAALHVASQADEISENATGPTLSTAMPLQIPHDRSGSLVLRRFSFRRHPKPATAACSESRLAIVEPMLQGYLTRKHVLNNFHTKAVSRRWREFFAVLHGSDLYLYATSTEELAESEPMSPRTGDASAVAVAGGQQNVSASGKSLLSRDSLSRLLIRTPLAFHPLRHALASPLPPRGYSPTRQHVFQLMLPNEELFLFQTHTHLEKIRWVTAINWWASRESHEPMPMAIGSGVFGFERFWLMGFVSGGVEELDREEEAAHMRRMNTGTQQTTADDAEMTVPSMDAPPFAPVRLAETVQESSLIDWVAPTLPFVPNSRRGKVDEATLLGKTSALRDAPIGVDELSLPTIDRQRVLWISRIKSLKEDMGAHLMAREILKHFGIGGGIQELVLAEQRRALQRKSLTTAPRPMSRLTAVSNDHEKVSCVTSFDSMHLDAVTTKPSSRPAGESQDHVDEMSIATSRSMDDRSSPSTIVTNMASNAGSDRPAKPNRLRRRNSTIVASSSANSISPLSPLSTSSTPPLFSGTHMQSHSRSTLSRASWSPFFNDSSFSVNSVANTMHLDNEEDGQFWRASHVIKVAGATMLKVNHHEMDEHAEPGPASSAAAELPAASDKKRLLATIRLPSPSYALVDIPNLPSCLITCIASPTATLQLPDFPRANRKMAARIEQSRRA